MGRRALGSALAVAVLLTVAGFVPLAWGVGLLAVLAWFAVPGLVLARGLYGGRPGGGIAALLAGLSWGYVLSSLVLLGLWAAGVRSFTILMVAPIGAAALVWPARRLRGVVDPPALTRNDLAAVAFVLLAVLAIVGRPYSRLGIDLADGRAYRAYFTADFVWAMAVSAEVSKGDVPPKNPYYRDDALHYYWLMHLLPSAEHRAGGGALRVEQALLANGLWASLMFGGFFYFFVRHFVERPWAAALACVGVLFCSSFEGIERLWWSGASLDQLRSVNIDAVGNWFYQGMKIDGLHRALFWQPQHLVGYLLGFSALLLLVEARDCSKAALLFLVGVFLGLSMLLSSPAAAMLAAVAAAYESFRLIQARQWKAFVPCAVAAALPMAGALALSAALQYVDTRSPGNPLVTFGVNRLATHRVWLTILLNFGPVIIVAVLGVAAAMWRGLLGRFVPIFMTVVVSAAFYVLVDVPDHGGVYVAWRASHLIFIALSALCGLALQEWWARGGWTRWSMTVIAALVAAAALPTVLIDIYNAQDVANRADGPGFKWTVVLTPAELEGLAWIRQNTPPNARVQIEPYSRNRDAYYVTAFGERRMSGGLPTGLIPLAKYEEVSGRIRAMYQSTVALDAHQKALGLCVDYLVVGPPEREAYPILQPALDAGPHLFAPVFRNEALGIYAVSGSWDQPQCPH
ncbi:MAG: hypothetical protein A3H97_16780 [Acidobacteria bacterium RIFCSPLOWO2_02_FULL_65_29]|nr:MAG: hypothetical protein A3H97_16780 [Acidobacteria bacterium RIFCSPLOWO2_02_FULL_65_29]